jgi:hypothetical protein
MDNIYQLRLGHRSRVHWMGLVSAAATSTNCADATRSKPA